MDRCFRRRSNWGLEKVFMFNQFIEETAEAALRASTYFQRQALFLKGDQALARKKTVHANKKMKKEEPTYLLNLIDLER